MDATISLQSLFWIAGGIAALWGLFKLFKQPFDKIDDHERRLQKLEDDRAERKQTDILILKSLNAITNHMIDGNSLDKLRAVRDDLQKSIIEGHK